MPRTSSIRIHLQLYSATVQKAEFCSSLQVKIMAIRTLSRLTYWLAGVPVFA